MIELSLFFPTDDWLGSGPTPNAERNACRLQRHIIVFGKNTNAR